MPDYVGFIAFIAIMVLVCHMIDEADRAFIGLYMKSCPHCGKVNTLFVLKLNSTDGIYLPYLPEREFLACRECRKKFSYESIFLIPDDEEETEPDKPRAA